MPTTKTYTLSSALEDGVDNGILNASSPDALSLTGNSLANKLTGNSLNNTLGGGVGAKDTLSGGKGDDVYLIGDTLDTVSEQPSQGVDLVVASVENYLLATNVENLRLAGSIVKGTGNVLANYLSGNDAGNLLDGGAGNDTVDGGLGNDNLVGGAGNDSLLGGAGDDLLDGGAGIDTMVGGAGNDTYVVDVAGDRAVEAAGGGVDWVRSSVNYTLAAGSEVENVSLVGATALVGRGNEVANVIVGNDKNNLLHGVGGGDNLIGAAGNDILVSGGANTTLDGGLGNDSLVGSGAAGWLSGGAGNDTLVSGGSQTTLSGGAGDDFIEVSYGQGEGLVIQGGLGRDTVRLIGFPSVEGGEDVDLSSLDVTKWSGIERVILSDGEEISFTLLRSLVTKARLDIETLNSNIAATNARTDSLSSGLANAQASISTLTSGLASAQGSISTLSAGLSDAQSSISTLASGLSNAQSNISTLASGLSAAQSDISTLTSGLSGAQSSISTLTSGLSGAQADISTLTSGLSGAQAHISTLTSGLSGAQSSISTLTSGLSGAQSDISTLTSGLSGAQSSISTLTSGLSGAQSDISTLTSGLSGAQSSISALTSGLSSTQANVSNLTSGLNSAQSNISSVEGRVTAIETSGDLFRRTDMVFYASTDVTLKGAASGGKNTLMGSSGGGVRYSGTTLYGANPNEDLIPSDDSINATFIGDSSLPHYMSPGTGTNLFISTVGVSDTIVGGAHADTLSLAGSAASDSAFSLVSGVDVLDMGTVASVTLGASASLAGFSQVKGGDSGVSIVLSNAANNPITLIGGTGNDTFEIQRSSSAGVSLNGGGGGTDFVASSSSVTLDSASGISNLLLLGTDPISGTGSALNNIIIGNSGANTLVGNGGNDSLVGMGGADSLVGGSGNDTYVPGDSAVIDLTAETGGTDMVVWGGAADYTLDLSLEHLLLTGTSANRGTGTSIANSLIGSAGANTLIGLDGDDTLSDGGGSGIDSLVGGVDDDLYYIGVSGTQVNEGASAGTDTVIASVNPSSIVVPENVEWFILAGNAIQAQANLSGDGTTAIVGNSLNNILQGAQSGPSASVSLMGEDGNDLYVVYSDSNSIVETAGNGDSDSLEAQSDYELDDLAQVEYLYVQSSGALTLSGNSLANTIVGATSILAGSDTLIGGGGNDLIKGGVVGVADSMSGGTGDDYFVVNDSADSVFEVALEGSDTVESSVSFALSVSGEVDYLLFTGSSTLVGSGDNSNNYIGGNSEANTLSGLAGADTLFGGAGADSMVGGAGGDVYFVDNAGDIVDDQGGDGAVDWVYSNIDFTLGSASELEVLSLSGGTRAIGNALANTLIGSNTASSLAGADGADSLVAGSGNDTLDGRGTDAASAFDTLVGGLGDDLYYVDDASDVITEDWVTGGTDSVVTTVDIDYSSVAIENFTLLTGADSLTANTLNNYITGTTGADTISGAGGDDTIVGNGDADSLVGGNGADYYILSASSSLGSGTVVIETGAEIDTVESAISFTLGTDVEHLILSGTDTLSGTGNGLDNSLIGNAGGNTLFGDAGDDTLVGGGGADSMAGGTDDDTYIVSDTLTVLVEAAAEGTDTVIATVNFTITDSQEIENLILQGSAVSGTANSLDNTITSRNGLAVTLTGGLGNDLYYIDSASSTIIEASGANTGTDTVSTGVTGYTLADNLELLVLTGSSAISGTGNALGNTLIGNSAASTLAGGSGDDVYFVANSSTVLTEADSAGTDWVYSSVNFTLAGNVEHMSLSAHGYGNELANSLVGAGGAQSLFGFAGDDTLVASGAETLVGGLGDDKYFVNSGAPGIVESDSEGEDWVYTFSNLTLSSYQNVEHVSVMSGVGLNVIGNSANNSLWGNAGNDTLEGMFGSDSLMGGDGDDSLVGGGDADLLFGGTGSNTLWGGGGNDTYIAAVGSTDTILDFDGTADVVWAYADCTLSGGIELLEMRDTLISGYGTTAAETLSSAYENTTLSGGAGSDTYLVFDSSVVVLEDTISAGTDVIRLSLSAGASYTLSGASQIEEVRIDGNGISVFGNSLSSAFFGGAGADTLVGFGGGTDTMTGGAGADTFVLGNSTSNYYSANSLLTPRGMVYIEDFDVTVDRIQLFNGSTGYTSLVSGSPLVPAGYIGIQDNSGVFAAVKNTGGTLTWGQLTDRITQA